MVTGFFGLSSILVANHGKLHRFRYPGILAKTQQNHGFSKVFLLFHFPHYCDRSIFWIVYCEPIQISIFYFMIRSFIDFFNWLISFLGRMQTVRLQCSPKWQVSHIIIMMLCSASSSSVGNWQDGICLIPSGFRRPKSICFPFPVFTYRYYNTKCRVSQ